MSFETDIFTTQMMAMLVKPEKLFEVLVNNFFSYSTELQGFFKDPNSLKVDDYFKYNIASYFNILGVKSLY